MNKYQLRLACGHTINHLIPYGVPALEIGDLRDCHICSAAYHTRIRASIVHWDLFATDTITPYNY